MKITMNTDELNFILTKLSKACDGKNSNRPILRAVHLEFENDVCTAVALNGFVLAMHNAPCQIVEGEGRIELNVLPDKLAKFAALTVELSDEIEGFLQIGSFGQKQLLPLMKGEYVSWRKIAPPKLDCPDSAPRRIAFDPALMKIVCDIAGKTPVRMKFGSAIAPCWCAVGDNTRVMLLPIREQEDAWCF